MLFGSLDRSIISMAENEQSGLEPGQRYKQNGVTWEVVGFSSFNGIPHVQMMKVGDPSERKLISVSTLCDSYDLVPE